MSKKFFSTSRKMLFGIIVFISAFTFFTSIGFNNVEKVSAQNQSNISYSRIYINLNYKQNWVSVRQDGSRTYPSVGIATDVILTEDVNGYIIQSGSQNSRSGNSFRLSFNQPGTYTYYIRQTGYSGSKKVEGARFDDSTKTVTVRVKADANNRLEARISNEPAFNNEYNPLPNNYGLRISTKFSDMSYNPPHGTLEAVLTNIDTGKKYHAVNTVVSGQSNYQDFVFPIMTFTEHNLGTYRYKFEIVRGLTNSGLQKQRNQGLTDVTITAQLDPGRNYRDADNQVQVSDNVQNAAFTERASNYPRTDLGFLSTEILPIKEQPHLVFIDQVSKLPNLTAIGRMSISQLTSTTRNITSARSTHSKLSNNNKQISDVITWENYLVLKEEAVGSDFLRKAQALPNNSTIMRLQGNHLINTQKDIKQARSSYNAIVGNARNNSNIVRWQGFLTSKEQVSGLDFINKVEKLPSLNVLKSLNQSRVPATIQQLQEARVAYNSLSYTVKQNPETQRWLHFLTLKEDAINTPGNAFAKAVQDIPSVSTIQRMNPSQLESTRRSLESARRGYNNLTASDKRLNKVQQWLEYLVLKERAVGIEFTNKVMAIPSVSAINNMSGSQLETTKENLRSARTSFNALSASAKRGAEVQKWYNFLVLKEQAAQSKVNKFVDAVDNLPNVSTINNMLVSQQTSTRANMRAARSAYNALSTSEKQNAQVKSRYGHLVAKERAIGIEFVNKAQDLPSVAAINNMSGSQLTNTRNNIQSARASYNVLSARVRQHPEVKQWNSYLTQKENAAK